MDQLLEQRIRKKLENLKDTSVERYEAREQRILNALEFSLEALKKLEGWALFAIFPSDEHDSEKYIRFVDQRFRCVTDQLQGFKSALRVCEKSENETHIIPGFTVDVSTLGEGRTNAADLRLSQATHCATGGHTRNPSGAEVRVAKVQHSGSLRHTDGFDLSHNDEISSTASNDVTSGSTSRRMTSLSDRVMSMAEHYVADGRAVQRDVSARLTLERQRLQSVTRWALESVSLLGPALDEPLADEIFYAARGRLSRVLAEAGVLEEAVTEIDRLMENGGENQTTVRDERENVLQVLGDESERCRTYSSSTSETTSDKSSMENGDWLGNYLKDSGVHELDLSCLHSSSSSTSTAETCLGRPSTSGNPDAESGRKQVSRNGSTKSTPLRPKTSQHEPDNSNSLRVENHNSNRRASDGVIATESFINGPTNNGRSTAKWAESSSMRTNSSLQWEESSIAKYVRTNGRQQLEPIRAHGLNLLKLDLDEGQSTTPEPPNSPRPYELNSHPRIIKDKLCNISLSARSYDRPWL